MKLLAVTSRFPFPIERGDKLRAHHQLGELAKRHDVVLVALAEAPVPAADVARVTDLGIRVHVVQRSRITTVASVARGALTGLPLQVGYFKSRATESAVRRLIADEQPDHVYCQLLRTAWVADGLGIPCTIDYQDAFCAAMTRRAEQQPVGIRSAFEFEARRIGRYEARAFEWFDQRVVISEQDRRLLEVPRPDAVTVLPNGVDTSYFSPGDHGTDTSALDPDDVVEVGFVGNMGYPPNVRASRMLAEEVMPLVRAHHGGARLLLAGARPSRGVRALAGPHVEVSGWLEDIRAAYRRQQVMVAPLFIGAGQQNKILEAMAMGVPCVTTELVNNAIGAVDRDEIMLAGTPEEFAAAIVELLDSRDRRTAMAERALAMVHERYSWASVGDQLSRLITKQVST